MARPLEDIQDEILDEIHAGRPVDREALLAAHPEHAEALQAFLSLLDVVEGDGEEGGVPPASLGEFRILREIGRGGMGVVYEAEQTSLKRRVALKVLPPALRLDARLVSRFQREAEAAGRLRHPGIVPVFGVGEAAGAPFFAMELVDGTTLRKIGKTRAAGEDAGLPREPEAWRTWAVNTIAKVADALAYAHAEGILHRDVKPANILIDAQGEPRLTDFGLARDMRSPGLSLTGEVLGSPQYMSPEQAIRHDTPVDERTDTYSLAVTLYQLLTLELPYAAGTYAELLTALAVGDVVPLRKRDPSIPKALEQVVMRALRQDPRERYRSAEAFAADLRATLAGQPLAFDETRRRRTTSRALLAIAAALVLAGLIYGQINRTDRAERNDDVVTTPEATDAPPMLAEVMRALEKKPPESAAEFDDAIHRLKILASLDTTEGDERKRVEDVLRNVYQVYVRGPGETDREAHEFLGHLEFTHEIPEGLTRRDYPYIRAVEWANDKRWFPPEEEREFQVAERAWDRTQEHLERLIHDAEFNRGDRARAVLQDRRLASLSLATRWSSPYLICFCSPTLISEFDALQIEDSVERRAQLTKLAEREMAVDALLDERAQLLQALYAEYVRRFEKPLGLAPLMAPWGGRPDMVASARSFRDGVPLVVRIFEDAEAFQSHVERRFGTYIASVPWGYFEPATTIAYFVGGAESREEHAQAVYATLYPGVQQLEFWFTRQKSHWRKPLPGRRWFDFGLGDYLSAVRKGERGELRFTGVNVTLLRAMQSMTRRFEKQGNRYRLFPLEKLVGFSSISYASSWGAKSWRLRSSAVGEMFRHQSWALYHFLSEAEGGRYGEQLMKYHALAQHRETGGNSGTKAFREAFRIRDWEDWQALDVAFQKHVRDVLMKLDASKYDYKPSGK